MSHSSSVLALAFFCAVNVVGASASCSQEYCTSPGNDCFANNYEPCSCSKGVAKTLNRIPAPHPGVPNVLFDIYNYTCCTDGSVEEDECGDYIPSSSWKPAPPYLSISQGNCTDHGYMTISGQAACKEAALQVGLPDGLVGVSGAQTECMVQEAAGTSSHFTKLCKKDPCLMYNAAYGWSVDGSHCALATDIGFYGSPEGAARARSLGVPHVAGKPLADAAACRNACSQQPGCDFYVFTLKSHLNSYSQRSCWLKSAVGCASGSHNYGYQPDHVVGDRNCQQDTTGIKFIEASAFSCPAICGNATVIRDATFWSPLAKAELQCGDLADICKANTNPNHCGGVPGGNCAGFSAWVAENTACCRIAKARSAVTPNRESLTSLADGPKSFVQFVLIIFYVFLRFT